jgi:hypothetical protein
MRLPQMFDEGTLGAKSEKEMNARGSPFLCGLDMGFEILDLHDQRHADRHAEKFDQYQRIAFSESR